MSDIRQAIHLPPTETIEFFRAKGEYPISLNYWDVDREEHTRGFTIAGVTDRTVNEAVRGHLDRMLSKGGTFAQWKSWVLPELRAAVENGTAPESILTERRLRTIYDTNLRMARAAGYWKRIQASKDIRPYLVYSALNDGHARPLHRRWGGLDAGTRPIVLPVDHPAWHWYFPPNGWGCRCRVIQASEAMLLRNGWTVTTDAELIKLGWPTSDSLAGAATFDWVRGDGAIETVPKGIDPGFDYNVGQAHMRGLVPPPLTGEIVEPRIMFDTARADFPPMPTARQQPVSLMMPANTDMQVVADAFIDSFGPRNSSGAVAFTDVLGQPLIIDNSFFFRGGVDTGPNSHKLGQTLRRTHIRYIAEALKNPDEIWHLWDEPKTASGRSRIVRRYVTRFEIDGQVRPMVIVMDISADGWKGVTAFAGRDPDYALSETVRGGVLAYRRK